MAVSLLATACASTGDAARSAAADIAVRGQLTSASAKEAEGLVNHYRASRGLAPVRLDAALTAVACEQANAMAAHDFMDHNIIGDFATRMRAHDIRNVYAGENIGRNFRTAHRMVAWWIGSPVHEANIANPHVRRLGFAVVMSASGRPYWTMDVAS